MIINPKSVGTGQLKVSGDLNVSGFINTDLNYRVGGVQGITRNITIMKTALTTCDMNIVGGIIIGSTC